ncbi:MAG: T9SS type A sorting domain-containing protein [Crocinitomicaceae bacterium]
MKRTLLFIGTIMATMTYAQDCSDLFISEYVEGVGNNKALEIYNPTGADIDLSEYIVIRYGNGATSASAQSAVQLSGTIGAYDVHVGVLEKLDPNGTAQDIPVWDSLQARADAFYSPEYAISNTFYWNGNDAVALAKGDAANPGAAVVVDIFGKIGEDPGDGWSTDFPYTGAGVVVTKDHSLIRKSTIMKGETNPAISFFDALAEYDSIPALIDIGGQQYGNWSSLGEHACGCTPASTDELIAEKVSVFPNPTNGTFYVKGAYGNVVVVNALGQTISTVKNNSSAVLSFDLGAKRGVYFVKMKDSLGNEITKRVIVK